MSNALYDGKEKCRREETQLKLKTGDSIQQREERVTSFVTVKWKAKMISETRKHDTNQYLTKFIE